MVDLLFIKDCRGYSAGQVAQFQEQDADKLKAQGVAKDAVETVKKNSLLALGHRRAKLKKE